ncbi:MAG TPA: CHAT domain-containing protein [Polyangiaceae bacterium]|nr:CHAT domain-containing protein [Polyangiaceae bacterium]
MTLRPREDDVRRDATAIVKFGLFVGTLLAGSLGDGCASPLSWAAPPVAHPPGSAAPDAQLPPGMVSGFLKPSPALSEALEREAPAIRAAALLRNSRQTSAQGEQQARAIAARIHQTLGDEPSEQMVLMHVMIAVSRAQSSAAFGKQGPLVAIIKAQAPHTGKPLADAMNSIGTVDLNALLEAFRKAYAGADPSEAARYLRAEFDRSETIYRMQPFESADHSNLHQTALRASNYLLDMALTLLERNPKNPELNALGYEMAVAYKARNPEVERRVSAALSESGSPEARSALEQWRASRESVASLELQLATGVALDERQRTDLARARSEEQRVLQHLSELAKRGRNQDKPFMADAGVQQLKSLLRADEAVLAFVEYRRVSPDDTTPNVPGRGALGAFVLTRAGSTFTSLGNSENLQRSVDAFLQTVGSAGASIEQKRAKSNELYTQLFAPVATDLSRSAKLRIVPDGALQLLPFEALYDGKTWLADRYQLSYAFSERQLLGEHAPALDFGPPLVLVPAYSKQPKLFRPGQRLTQENFPALDRAAAEGRHVQALLPNAKLVVGQQATESVLSAGRPPRVLHIAGHGVLLPLKSSTGPDDRGLVLSNASLASLPSSEVDPMVLSTLVLAPDAARKSDGFLTAYEAAAVPLWGTALVVLSACESGRGSPDRIKGVHGLRRAFFTAGAESLVTSLWSVSDAATDEMMSAFYTNLKAGLGRGEALRKASATLRAKNQDPFVWAPFILLGDTTPLSFSRIAASAPLGEDAESRSQRAWAQKRLTHSSTHMGQAKWGSASGQQQALDAYVKRQMPPQRGQMLLTLLGQTESVSLVVLDYPGPGTYSIEHKQLVAGTSPVKDPFEVDIKNLSAQSAAIGAKGGTLEVLQDSVAGGFVGRFTLRLDGGRTLSGEFHLESVLPALPEVLQQQ